MLKGCYVGQRRYASRQTKARVGGRGEATALCADAAIKSRAVDRSHRTAEGGGPKRGEYEARKGRSPDEAASKKEKKDKKIKEVRGKKSIDRGKIK